MNNVLIFKPDIKYKILTFKKQWSKINNMLI